MTVNAALKKAEVTQNIMTLTMTAMVIMTDMMMMNVDILFVRMFIMLRALTVTQSLSLFKRFKQKKGEKKGGGGGGGGRS